MWPPAPGTYQDMDPGWGRSLKEGSRPYSPSRDCVDLEEEVEDHEMPMQEEVVLEEEEVQGMPSKIFDCIGTVVTFQSMVGCGILELQGGSQNVYCFFLASQVQGFLCA